MSLIEAHRPCSLTACIARVVMFHEAESAFAFSSNEFCQSVFRCGVLPVQ